MEKQRQLQYIREQFEVFISKAVPAERKTACFGFGPADAKVAFVKESFNDSRADGIDAHLEYIFRSTGLTRSDVYITPAIKCKHIAPGYVIAAPNAVDYSLCRWTLMSELLAVSPKLVVAVGDVSFQVITGTDRQITSDISGSVIPVFVRGAVIPVCPVRILPSAQVHSAGIISFEQETQKLSKLINSILKEDAC